MARSTVLRALVAAVALAAVLVPTASAGMRPVIAMKSNIGKVVATEKKLGIYTWDVEKKAKGAIRCRGACAREWPPVYVKGAVPKHVAGVMATLGTIKRGARRQLTVNGLPAYTYVGDTARVVTCDGVDGWHAVRP